MDEFLSLKFKLKILLESARHRWNDIITAKENHISEKTLSKWCNLSSNFSDRSKPSGKKLYDLCNILGIDYSKLNLPLSDFIKWVSNYYGKSTDDLIAIIPNDDIKNNLKDELNKDFPYLKNTLGAVNLSDLENDFEMLKGHYNTFKYLDPSDENEGKISVTHAEIYDIDRKNRVLKCRFPSYFGNYEGCIIKAKNKLFILIESLKGFHYFPEVLSIILHYPKYWETNDDNFLLYGVFNSLSIKGRPCCARIILKKIIDQRKLFNVGFYFKDDITGINNFEMIEKWIHNDRVDYKRGLICDDPDNLELLSIDDSQANIVHYIKDRLALDYNQSFEIFKILEDKVFFHEYRKNFDRSIEIYEVDKDGYRKIKITTDYELINSDRNNLLFSCSLEGVTTDIVNDENCEVSWIFVPIDKNVESLPNESFSVDSVYIDNIKFIPKQILNSDKRVEFIVDENLKSRHKIHYTFTVKQAAKYCFVSDYLTKITHNYTVELDVKDENVKDVYPKEYLLLSGQHRDQNEKDTDLTKYTIYGDGWLLPRSGVSFSWSMK